MGDGSRFGVRLRRIVACLLPVWAGAAGLACGGAPDRPASAPPTERPAGAPATETHPAAPPAGTARVAPAAPPTSAAGASAAGAPGARSAAAAGIKYTGGGGTGCDDVVVITGAATQAAGADAERAWLSAHRPGIKVVGQTLTTCSQRPTDKFHLETSDGRAMEVYFDATSFYGKY